jgi:hypothetical protein
MRSAGWPSAGVAASEVEARPAARALIVRHGDQRRLGERGVPVSHAALGRLGSDG